MRVTNETRSSRLRTTDQVEAAIARYILPVGEREDRLGLEIEGFPFHVGSAGPPSRARLTTGTPSLIEIVDTIADRDSDRSKTKETPDAYVSDTGGRITFEPGAQIEYSTVPWTSTAGVVRDANQVWDAISDTLWDHRICLVGIGLDPWTDPARIPQQLSASRYGSMAKYLGERGNHGAVMMRNTCAIQVNLDQGGEGHQNRRWLVGNLISPLLTAMFSTSPGQGEWSIRARSWQQLDPTRTGFPSWTSTVSADILSDTIRRTLQADVIYIIREDETITGHAGWSFHDWLVEGHPSAGSPTEADLKAHLSTLFTELRPREGLLEFRGIDALPQRWWLAPLTLTAAVAYDEKAADDITDLLEAWVPKLDDVWHTAASVGLGDDELREAAIKLGTIALDAADRNGHQFDQHSINVTADFLETHTLRGLSPGSVLQPLIGCPQAAIKWAVPQHTFQGVS